MSSEVDTERELTGPWHFTHVKGRQGTQELELTLQGQRPSGPWLALPGTVCLARSSHWPPSSREEVQPPSPSSSRKNQVSSRPFAPTAGRVQKGTQSKGQIDSYPWHFRGTEARGNPNDCLTEQRREPDQALVRGPDLMDRGQVTAETKGSLAFPGLTDPDVVVSQVLRGVRD